MVEIVLFLPGILGSKLEAPDGTEVWPPTPLEVLAGYKRIEELLRTDLRPSGIITTVCIDAYGGVLKAVEKLGYNSAHPALRLEAYPYDWRRDVISLAAELDAHLTNIVETYGPSI